MAERIEITDYQGASFANSTSFSFTANPGDVLVCMWTGNDSSNALLTPTYDGISLTQLESRSNGTDQTKIFAMLNPSSGDNTFAASSSVNDCYLFVASIPASGYTYDWTSLGGDTNYTINTHSLGITVGMWMNHNAYSGSISGDTSLYASGARHGKIQCVTSAGNGSDVTHTVSGGGGNDQIALFSLWPQSVSGLPVMY